MPTRRRRLFAAIIMAALFLAGCSKGASSSATAPSSGSRTAIPVALIADLTGTQAQNGNPLTAGIKGFFHKLNDSGGIHGAKVNLTIIDGRTTPDGAQAAVRQVYGM